MLGRRSQDITITGKGAPDSEEFQTKIAALYSVAYGVEISVKKVKF